MTIRLFFRGESIAFNLTLQVRNNEGFFSMIVLHSCYKHKTAIAKKSKQSVGVHRRVIQ